MEWTTMTSHHTQLLFLDWKQAFDSVDHPAMMNALQRFGLPNDCLSLVNSIYTFPSFTTRGFMGAESHGVVNSGIRQGCPLSPYLFIIVLSVIFKDLDDRLMQQGTPTNTWSEGKPVYDIEYADDTLLFALTTPQLQPILNALEWEAACYGMSLNNSKTELLVEDVTQPSSLTFIDGTPVNTTTQVKYLGSLVSWNNPLKPLSIIGQVWRKPHTRAFG
jgi:hypothetical protein